MISQLLLEMDEMNDRSLDGADEQFSDVIVLAATNCPDMMDPAFLRPGTIPSMLSLAQESTIQLRTI